MTEVEQQIALMREEERVRFEVELKRLTEICDQRIQIAELKGQLAIAETMVRERERADAVRREEHERGDCRAQADRQFLLTVIDRLAPVPHNPGRLVEALAGALSVAGPIISEFLAEKKEKGLPIGEAIEEEEIEGSLPAPEGGAEAPILGPWVEIDHPQWLPGSWARRTADLLPFIVVSQPESGLWSAQIASDLCPVPQAVFDLLGWSDLPNIAKSRVDAVLRAANLLREDDE